MGKILNTQQSSVFLVVATRQSARQFSRATLLGQSLRNFSPTLRPKLLLYPNNEGSNLQGLSTIYNLAIEKLPDQGIVAFVHDDLYLHDWHLNQRLEEALRYFDVVGLVGSVTADDDQPSWCFRLDPSLRPQRVEGQRASGYLNHHNPYQPELDVYGTTPHSCRLLDGVFLACRLSTLKNSGLRFDPQFDFHCYDSDFCRSAESLGLRIGTWPISCTHGSLGKFDNAWISQAQLWLRKWHPSSLDKPSAH